MNSPIIWIGILLINFDMKKTKTIIGNVCLHLSNFSMTILIHVITNARGSYLRSQLYENILLFIYIGCATRWFVENTFWENAFAENIFEENTFDENASTERIFGNAILPHDCFAEF